MRALGQGRSYFAWKCKNKTVLGSKQQHHHHQRTEELPILTFGFGSAQCLPEEDVGGLFVAFVCNTTPARDNVLGLGWLAGWLGHHPLGGGASQRRTRKLQ